MGNNNTKTRAFDTVSNGSDNRRKTVIAIFVVIALILAAFATLIIGKLVSELPLNPGVPSNLDLEYAPLYAEDIKKGNLLVINNDYKYELPSDLSNMLQVYSYINNSENSELTKIQGFSTYLSHTPIEKIVVESTTLKAFSKMLYDYCNENVNNVSKDGLSNISITWGGYTEATRGEYQDDIDNPNLNGEYYDHGLGTTLVLRIADTAEAINERLLKEKYSWIYQNAHKYGFVLRYPNACKDHTGKDSSVRAHLRYVGVEHATYMYEAGICLEEYIDLLKTNYNSVYNPLKIETESGSYEVYYIPFNGNPTSVPVPKNSNYTISGDNMNGFIVSVKK